MTDRGEESAAASATRPAAGHLGWGLALGVFAFALALRAIRLPLV